MRRLLPSVFIAIVLFTSCEKDPVEVVVPPAVVSYSVADSMHLSANIITSFPELSTNYNNKTYLRETNKVKSSFKVEGADLILIFEDTSVANLGTELSIKITNKTLSNIAGSYTAQNRDIFYSWKQRLSSSAYVFSVGYTKADTCNIQISYDDKTKTLSGTITKLKYPFGVYLPYYMVGTAVIPRQSDDVFLTSGGSFRQHTITFQYIKSL